MQDTIVSFYLVQVSSVDMLIAKDQHGDYRGKLHQLFDCSYCFNHIAGVLCQHVMHIDKIAAMRVGCYLRNMQCCITMLTPHSHFSLLYHNGTTD